MARTRTTGMPVKSRRLLDALFDTLVVKESERGAIEREEWVEGVRAELLEWKKEWKGAHGQAPRKEECEHFVALIGLETLAERLMLVRGEDIRGRLPEERAWSLLGKIDSKDLEVYRRCEIEIETPSRVADSLGSARDEILRRWSRARHQLAMSIREG